MDQNQALLLMRRLYDYVDHAEDCTKKRWLRAECDCGLEQLDQEIRVFEQSVEINTCTTFRAGVKECGDARIGKTQT